MKLIIKNSDLTLMRTPRVKRQKCPGATVLVVYCDDERNSAAASWLSFSIRAQGAALHQTLIEVHGCRTQTDGAEFRDLETHRCPCAGSVKHVAERKSVLPLVSSSGKGQDRQPSFFDIVIIEGSGTAIQSRRTDTWVLA